MFLPAAAIAGGGRVPATVLLGRVGGTLVPIISEHRDLPKRQVAREGSPHGGYSYTYIDKRPIKFILKSNIFCGLREGHSQLCEMVSARAIELFAGDFRLPFRAPAAFGDLRVTGFQRSKFRLGVRM